MLNQRSYKTPLVLAILLLMASGLAWFIWLEIFDYVIGNSYLWLSLGAYFCILIAFALIEAIFPNRIPVILVGVFLAPLALITKISQLVHPAAVICMYGITFLCLSVMVPAVMIESNHFFSFYQLTPETEFFFTLTGSSIISLGLFGPISRLSHAGALLRFHPSEKMSEYQFPELINYLFTKTHLRFLIYLFFLIYLLLYSVSLLEGQNLLDFHRKDLAILQSFLCFLAFDRVSSNTNLLNLNSQPLLEKLWTSVLGKSREEKR